MISNAQWTELNKEYPPIDEEQDIQTMLGLSADLHHKQEGVYRRGQHAKDTGCVKAEFIVEPNLAENLKFGVFREAKTYEAIVRYSNGSGELRSDKSPDGRGMAIKLLNAEGTKVLPLAELKNGQDQQQDFIMIAHPTFAFGTVKVYLKFFNDRKTIGDENAVKTFMTAHPDKGTIIIDTVSIPVANTLNLRYWSMSPYSLGSQAIKFSAKPQAEHNQTAEGNGNFLFKALEETLQQEEAYFDFMIQLQTDPQKTPVEDVSIEWEEKDAPFVKVATVKIPRQDLESPELQAFRQQCELLAWNPWHSLVEHKPLGGINRLRRAVYTESAKRRLAQPSGNGQ